MGDTLKPEHSTSRRRAVLGLTASAALSAVPALAFAQTYPTKPVRFIVAFSPGGPVDSVSRTVAKELTDLWGQPVVVENRPGAAGTIAAGVVSKSPPDGYTFLVTDVAIVVVSLTRGKQQGDPLAELTPLTQLLSGPMVLAVSPSFPAKTFPEMIKLAKERPKKFSYASVGPGSISHLASEMLNSAAGVDIVHVPYQGAGQLMPDLMSGTIEMAFLGISVSSPLIQTGKLRALAVSGKKRAPLLPDVPAIDEFYPGYEVNSWYGMFAPPGTPPELTHKVQQDIATVMNRPEVAKTLRSRGSEIEASTPEAFARKLKDDARLFEPTVKAADLIAK